jgi:hypothetical protein
MRAFADIAVAEAFAAHPPAVQRKLLALRALIFATAARTRGVGELEETLKWGQPAYLTPETKSGTTIRIDRHGAEPARVALYFHCQTGLVESFRRRFPKLAFEGNRAIVLGAGERVPKAVLSACIAAALTYHRRAKSVGAFA